MLRMILLVLLSVAIPAQAFDATGLGHCAGGQHVAHGQVAKHDNDHDQADTSHAHDGSDRTRDAVASVTNHDTLADPASAAADHRCSACAGCCSSAAISSPSAIFADLLPDTLSVIRASRFRVGLHTARLERPPLSDWS